MELTTIITHLLNKPTNLRATIKRIIIIIYFSTIMHRAPNFLRTIFKHHQLQYENKKFKILNFCNTNNKKILLNFFIENSKHAKKKTQFKQLHHTRTPNSFGKRVINTKSNAKTKYFFTHFSSHFSQKTNKISKNRQKQK